MKVLGISADWGSGFLRTVRLEVPLSNLRRQGLIKDFAVTDRFLRNVNLAERYDAVWLQRVDDASLITTLKRTIENRYLYDIDDFLLGRAAYLQAPLTQNAEAVVHALNSCVLVACTTSRLKSLLESASGCSLGGKTVICPNGAEFAYGSKPNEVPRGVVWVSSVNAALECSWNSVVNAIDRFVRRRRLPVWFVGNVSSEIVSAIDGIRRLGAMSYWQYTAWLASCPPMIAVAPLETEADPGTLAVIQGKSDVKMAEYGGFGHLGVYSDSPPYRDSDLHVGSLVENTREAWEECLEMNLSARWKTRRDEQERVVSLRHMDRIAREHWLPALERVRLDSPMQARDIVPHARRGVVMRDVVTTLNAHSAMYAGLKKLLPSQIMNWLRNR